MRENHLFKNKHRIKSARLPYWDYSSNGYYFATICTKNHYSYFGRIADGEMQLSKIGEIVRKSWLEIPKHFPFVKLDEFVIMPNHVHGIIIIENDNCRDVACNVSTKNKNLKSAISPKRGSLSTIIRSYKSAVTKSANTNDIPFAWQARFYDHIIRDDKSLLSIQEYICNNIIKWELDKYYRQT